jgi:aspartyl-tRNA(Asn)/glutamyl-tRNA(Gln) amidotransferase subunit B
MNWEIVIGLETHAQLSTRSKMFSGASTQFGAPPNTQASAVDIALPGVLPVANRGAVERAIRFGLAVGGEKVINRRSVFARKNYFYPDLPKGYQISQYELPIIKGGEIRILTKGGEKVIRLTRAHLEEDAGKSLHEDFHGMSGIDLNRAGTPLLEIVSEPDMRSAEEAVTYAKALHSLVRWIGICDGNMQEGSFRCDANVSVRRAGDTKLGTRCEIKNLNSFRFMEQAIEFEAKRQIEILEDGGKIVQETRLYDSDRDETRSMRSKEEAHDYRYFPDPDLLPLMVSEEWIGEARQLIDRIGTPEGKYNEYVTAYQLTRNDARYLVEDRDISQYFEAVVQESAIRQFDRKAVAKLAVTFIAGELAAALSRENISITHSRIKPTALAGLMRLVLAGELPISPAIKLFTTMWNEGRKLVSEAFANLPVHPKVGADIIRELTLQVPAGEWQHTATATVTAFGLWPMADVSELEKICDEVLAANAKQVEDYRAGKEKAFNSLVGQVMKATQGKANPTQVNEILKKKLAR